MDKEKQPGINFNNVILKELSFSRNPGVLPKPELNLNFSNVIAISPDKKNLNYELSCSIDEAGKSFFIKCTMVGMFSIIEENANLSLEEFSKNNAPALIFPYIREIVASTTLKAGIPSVILPPLNIQAVFNKATEKK